MVSPSLSVHPYKEADHIRVLALLESTHDPQAGVQLNVEGAINSEQNNLIIIEDGGKVEGVAIWIWPSIVPDSKVPTLSSIVLSASHIGRRDLYDKLLDAVAEAGQVAGHMRADAIVIDEAVLNLMVQDFDIDKVTPVGTDTETGKPGYWIISFDLAKNRTILAERLK